MCVGSVSPQLVGGCAQHDQADEKGSEQREVEVNEWHAQDVQVATTPRTADDGRAEQKSLYAGEDSDPA